MTRAGEKLYGDWNRSNGIDPNEPENLDPQRRSRVREGVVMLTLIVALALIFGWPILRIAVSAVKSISLRFG